MQPFKRLWIHAAFISIAAGAGIEATGGEPSPSDPVRYEGAYFLQFSPRTALDIVQRVPSFTLREVDEERRGFTGAAGNVLIDGKQPSAKRQSVEDILQRIPASQVLRIEVLRGNETAGDASGDALLVNVVRTPSAGTGAWSAGFEYAQQDEAAPNGDLAWAGRVRDLEYGVGARTYALKRELPGTRTVTDAEGEPLEIIEEQSPREFDEYALDGEVASDVLGGRLRVTGQIYASRYAQANVHERRSVDGRMLADELAPYSERKRTIEFGTHFESIANGWQWTTAALVTRDRFDADAEIVTRGPDATVQSEFEQAEVRDTGESILRTTIERAIASAQRLQIGTELALNTLDADLKLTGRFEGGETIPIKVPNANMRVDELRGEVFVLHTWRGQRWAAETRLAAETSRLDFSGDAQQRVDLSFFKPSLQFTRAIGGHQLRAGISREVGQLDFADFASAAALADDRIEGGNPDLVPQTAWRMEVGADFRLNSQTAVSVRAYRDWIDDVADLVPLGELDDGISAPGNIGDGTLYGVHLTLAASLSRIVPGGTFKADVTLQDTSVTDPITGRERTISEFVHNKFDAEFRQDIARHRLAWGAKYKYVSSETSYFTDETDRTRPSPSLDLFIERTIFGGLKLTLTWVSIQNSPEMRRRTFYEPDRTGSVMSIEDTRREPGRWWMLTLSGAL